MKRFEELIRRAWYEDKPWIRALSPLSKLYAYEFDRRKRRELAHRRPPFFLPVIVVGNINVGGTGKTPLIIDLVSRLERTGRKVGVVSRGYGASPPSPLYRVEKGGDVQLCGDEPLMIAEATEAVVVIGEDRCAAVQEAINAGVNIVLSDDGLQHHALPRHFEIVVIDAVAGLGNGLLLPAGPLRESPERLATVDFVVCNGAPEKLDDAIPAQVCFQLEPTAWLNVVTGTRVPLDFVQPNGVVDAVAGIGNPDRFFTTLKSLGFSLKEHAFPDHHMYTPKDFSARSIDQESCVLMTQKDALKCRDIAGPNYWALDVEPVFHEAGQKVLMDAILDL